MLSDASLRPLLIGFPAAGIVLGFALRFAGLEPWVEWVWALSALPVLLALSVPIDVVETPGEGICGKVTGRSVVVGGIYFVASLLPEPGELLHRDCVPLKSPPGAAIVALAVDGRRAGRIVLADELRTGIECLLGKLRRLGIERIVCHRRPARCGQRRDRRSHA
jgi:hypothetical protein